VKDLTNEAFALGESRVRITRCEDEIVMVEIWDPIPDSYPPAYAHHYAKSEYLS
jgi:hypothetical protein